jgi:ATP synthase protein I
MTSHDTQVHRVLAIQSILIAATAGVFLVVKGYTEAQAAMYGGAIALLSAWMLARRMRTAELASQTGPQMGMQSLMIGAVLRFVVVLGLFALGMGWLELSPLPLIIGFAVAQIAFVVSGPAAMRTGLTR